MKKLLISLVLILSLMLSMGLSAFAEEYENRYWAPTEQEMAKVKKELYIDGLLKSSVGAGAALDLVDIYIDGVDGYNPRESDHNITFNATVSLKDDAPDYYVLEKVVAEVKYYGTTTSTTFTASSNEAVVTNCKSEYQYGTEDEGTFSYYTTLKIYLKSVFSTPGGSIGDGETYGENIAEGVTNEGTINDNKINGSITNNYGTVVENNGIIENNFGRVIKNCNRIVNHFFTDYTVPIPGGIIENYYHPLSIEGQLRVTPNEPGGGILDNAWIKSLSRPDPNSLTTYSYTVEAAEGWVLDDENPPTGCGIIKKDGKWIIANIIAPVRLVAKPVPVAPGVPGEPGASPVPAPVTDVPATGDMSNLPLWSALLLLFAVTAIVTKKKKV